MHLEPFTVIVRAQVSEEEQGVGVDGRVRIGYLARLTRFGEFDEDGFAGGCGGFYAWAPELLTFFSGDDGDAAAVAFSDYLSSLAGRIVFGGRVFVFGG